MRISNCYRCRAFCGLLLIILLGLGLPALALADKGLLFKIQKTGYPVSYLFGTIHSSDPRVLAVPETVNQAITASDSFVMEIKFDKNVLIGAMTGMWLTDGRSLQDVIGEEVYQLVADTAARTGIPEASFSSMKPWVVMMMFSLPPGDYEKILDIELMKTANAQGKRVRGLESFQEQFDVIDKMSEQDQVVLLKNTLKNYPQLTTQYAKLLNMYLNRDLQGLLMLADQQTRGDTAKEQRVIDRLMSRMLDDRNQRMLERMLKILQQESAFIAIGALHLPGDYGVIQGLRNQGFSVTAVQ